MTRPTVLYNENPNLILYKSVDPNLTEEELKKMDEQAYEAYEDFTRIPRVLRSHHMKPGKKK